MFNKITNANTCTQIQVAISYKVLIHFLKIHTQNSTIKTQTGVFFNQNSNHVVAYTCAFFAFAIKISAWKCKKCHLQEKKIAGFEVVKKNQYV